MAKRVEEYQKPDGTWTTSKSAAVRCTPDDVAAAVSGSLVPVEYYQGTAKHESGYALNERDTEPSGFQSWGIFQVSDEEAQSVGEHAADLVPFNPDKPALANSARAMMKKAEQRQSMLIDAAKKNNPTRWGNLTPANAPPDLAAFVAAAHNLGIGTALEAIKKHDLSWDDFERENPSLPIVKHGYGRDCMPSGGALAGGGGGALVAVGAFALLGFGAWLYFGRPGKVVPW